MSDESEIISPNQEEYRTDDASEGPELERPDYLWFIGDLYKRGDVLLTAESISYITARLGKELASESSSDSREWNECFRMGETTRLLMWQLSHLDISDALVTSEQIQNLVVSVQRVYGYLQSDLPLLRHFAQQMIPDLLVIDGRLSQIKKGSGLYDRYRTDLLKYLSSPHDEKDLDNAAGMLDAAFARGGLEGLVIPAFKEVHDKEGACRVFALFSNRISPAICLHVMREAARTDAEFRSKARQLYAWLDLMPPEGDITDVKELYEHKFDISQWKPNDETLQFDTAFIRSHMGHARNVLDIACGAGRHMAALTSEGMHITGIDIAETNVKHIKAQRPDADAAVASWHHLPFGHERFDGAYCLGRSFQHNATIEDVEMALREAWSVLKLEGVLLIDSASTQMGYVGQKKTEFDDKMKRLHVYHSQPGLMVSSPNGIDFVERYVPSPETFKNLALVAGFHLEQVTEQRYTDHHGKENVNYYYVLKKVQPTSEDKLEAERQTAYRVPIVIKWF